jgi:hypothetical protein
MVFVVRVIVLGFAFTSGGPVVHGACITSFFCFSIQVLLNPVHDFLQSGYVETDMNFTISRCSRVRLDYVRNIERLTFAMTNTDYFVVSGMQNDDGAVNAYSLGPGLKMFMRNVTRELTDCSGAPAAKMTGH